METRKKIKVTTILGTRPEIIRLAEIIKRFDSYFDHRVVHTGQNSQPELSEVFFHDLSLRRPDVDLGINAASLGDFLGVLYPAIEKDFLDNKPDAVLILGDTNSSLISILAKRMKIPVYHLEAGNRSFDLNVPEEINRKIIDHSSDFHLCYTAHAAKNLEKEGIHSRFIAVIGSPLREVFDSISSRVQSSKILNQLELNKDKFFVVSIHRQENIDSPERLGRVVQCLNSLAREYDQPVIVSAHPRLVSKISRFSEKLDLNIRMLKPFGYVDFLKLQMSSRLVISDSGSVSEESAILGFKAVTLRDSMERPEALEAGSIIMTGTDETQFAQAIQIALAAPNSALGPQDYLIPDTSTRVVNFLVSTLGQYKFWNGIR